MIALDCPSCGMAPLCLRSSEEQVYIVKCINSDCLCPHYAFSPVRKVAYLDRPTPPKWDWQSAREDAINKWNETAKHLIYPDSKVHE